MRSTRCWDKSLSFSVGALEKPLRQSPTHRHLPNTCLLMQTTLTQYFVKHHQCESEHSRTKAYTVETFT